MSDLITQLRATVDMLQHAYDKAHAEMAKEYHPIDPMRMRTPDGRYILLDALVTLVNAQTALLQAERAL